MYFAEAIAEIARRFGKVADDKDFKSIAGPLVSLAYLDVGKSWDWVHLKAVGSILAIPIYDTGTAAWTQDTNTVTLSAAATIDTTFKGRFFRKQGGENTYRIVNVAVPTRVLTLDQQIVEDNETAATYEIEKRYYTIPTEVRRITGWDRSGTKVLALDHDGLRSVFPDRSQPLADVPFEIHGTDEFTDDYETGRISTSEDDTDVVTGTGGMLWLTNAQAGNILRIEPAGTEARGFTLDYRIKRVEGDDRMVLYNKIAGKIDGESYSISVDSALTVRLRAEFTSRKVIQFSYIRTVFDLIHDEDIIRLPREAKLAVLDFAQAYVAEALPVTGWERKLIKAQGRLASAQDNASPVRAAYKTFPPLIARGMGRR